MAKRICVIEVNVYSYVPDLNEETYKENGIDCIEAAMKHDKTDCEKGEITPDELSPHPAVTSRVWSIIGE